MSSNPVQHRRTKHIEINIHFVREKVALGQVRVLHVPTTAQFADIFTKALATAPFTDIRFSLNVVEPHVETAGDVTFVGKGLPLANLIFLPLANWWFASAIIASGNRLPLANLGSPAVSQVTAGAP